MVPAPAPPNAPTRTAEPDRRSGANSTPSDLKLRHRPARPGMSTPWCRCGYRGSAARRAAVRRLGGPPGEREPTGRVHLDRHRVAQLTDERAVRIDIAEREEHPAPIRVSDQPSTIECAVGDGMRRRRIERTEQRAASYCPDTTADPRYPAPCGQLVT